MARIRNMGAATARFGEGVIMSGSAGTDVHALVVTGSTTVLGDITCNNISIGADASGTGRTISAGNTDTSLRFNASDGVDIVVGGSFFISCDENASQDTIVVNTSGHDIDFRVESDNKEYQIFSDAGNDLLVLGSDVEIPDGVGSDTSIIISGSQDGQGNVVFTGDVVMSGALGGEKIYHNGDTDTSISFDADNISFEAGGNTELQIDGTEGILVKEFIKHIGDTDTRIQFADNKIVLKAGNLALVTAEKNSSAPHEVTINDGSNNVDFVVKGNGSNQGNPGMKFDASTNKLGINGIGTPAYELEVAGNIGLAEYIYHRGDENTYIRFQDDDINLQAGGRSMVKMSEGSIDQVLIMSGGGGTSPDVKDYTDTNFFVSGSIGSKGTTTAGTSVFGGDVVVSGSLYFTQKYVHTVKFTNTADATKKYVRWESNGVNSAPGVNNKWVAPADGRLSQVVIRSTHTPGNTTLGFHRVSDGTENFSSTAIETQSVDLSTANTSAVVGFSSNASFSQGEVVGFSMHPTSVHGNVNISFIFELDFTS